MKRVVVDTNVLVSFLTDRNPDQQAQATKLIEKAAGGDLRLILHQIVITEIVYVLQNLYEVEKTEVARMLDDLLLLPGILLDNEVSWSRVRRLWPAPFTDLADAVLASVATGAPYDSIATFDLGFRQSLGKMGAKSFWSK